MIIINNLEEKKQEQKENEQTIKSKQFVYEIDGMTFYVTREFKTSGKSILENLIIALLNKMDEQEME